jgi:flagellar protein FliO/FliZ
MNRYLVSTFGSSLGESSEPPQVPPMDFTGNFIEVIVTLAVIVGLIVLLIRFLAAKNKRWSGERSLRVHAGVTLGQHKSLQIIEIGDAVYIVGVGENVTLLDKIDDPQRAFDLLSSLEVKPSAAAGTIVTTLAQILGRLRKPTPAQPEVESWQSNEAFRDLLSKKLQGIGNRKETMKAYMEEDPMQRRSTDGT